MLDQIFFQETTRVKSCCFHHTKPILITAHHDGTIQIYHYILKCKLALLNEHVGPVRAIIFHPFLEIFASGGDDTKIRIWDFRTKKVICIFDNHKDYIRSLDFHPIHPYLLSCGDDQTVRIFNFQSKKLLATLIGHTHYVMSCKFFLENYIVSVSLDQSIRLWDYTNLNQKKSFLSVPVIVKQIIEAHEKGINCVSVRNNLIATASDDKEVKIFEFNEIISELQVLHSHTNIVSSVILLEDFLISNGEDGIVCLYNLKKKVTEKFNIVERFWCLAFKDDLILSGSDTGLYLFATKPNKPAFCFKEGLLYIKNNCLLFNDLENEKVIKKIQTQPNSINFKDQKIVLQFENYFELFDINEPEKIIKERGFCILAENVYFLKNRKIYEIKEKNTLEIDETNFEKMFYLCKNRFLAVRNSKIFLLNEDFDILKQKPLFNFQNAIFNEFIAVWNENEIAILDLNLEIINQTKELIPILTAFFYNKTVIYSTQTQIKFINEEVGLIKCIKDALVFQIIQENLYYLKNEIICEKIDFTELNFVNALVKKDTEKLKEIILRGDLMGITPVKKLIKYKLGDLAINYITDISYKFKLCLSEKKFVDSFEFAKQLNSPTYFKDLANECLINCEYLIAEKCFIELNDHKNLFILYLCTKQFEKMEEFDFDENVLVLVNKVLKKSPGELERMFEKLSLSE